MSRPKWPSMNCHYCDREAAFAAESDGLRVGLCEEHFRERLQELAEADGLETLKEQVDVDRAE
ncbi:hypothetical protein JCM18750_17740 [Halostagnicola bangensis]